MQHKKGIDYFSFDVDFFQDDKILFVSARFGTKGEAIAVRLLCKIYRQGYYTEWNEDIALLFAKSVGDGVQHSCVNDVVHELIKRGFFDKSIFDRFSILTSTGIQRRFLEASSRRKEVEVISDYLLVNTEKYKNVNISSLNVDIKRENVDILKQSKVKKRKVKESNKNTARFSPPAAQEVRDYCNQRNNKVDAEAFVDFYTSKDWMIGKNKMKDWKAAVRTWERKKNGGSDNNKKNSFNNFNQRAYDYDDLEKKLLMS